MTLRYKYAAIAGGVLALTLALYLGFFFHNASAKESDAAPARVAPVALVVRKPLENSITLSGEFRPFQQVDVHAKVAGYIRQIFVDVGDKVKTGQVLAILEVPELNAQVAGAKADIRRGQDAIRRAESEIQRTESTHAAYHTAYTRLKQASDARPGLIAEQELDDSMAKDKETSAQIVSAQAALSESQSQLGVAQAELDRVAAMESYAHIAAPFSGVITKRYADTGALIQAGTASDTQAMPVVQLAEWTKLRLVVPVPESAVPELHFGGTVQVHVSALNRDFQGKVARFADSLSDQTRTMHTEIDVENPDGTLKEGMYADAKIVLQRIASALTVPIQAVERGNSKASVLIVNAQGQVEEREIKTGVESSDTIEVLGGLAENDRVIVANRGSFRPGEKVQTKIVAGNTVEAEGGL